MNTVTRVPGHSPLLTRACSPAGDSSSPFTWRHDALLLGLLLAVAIGVKAWLFQHTDAIARDGIVYILIANRYEEGPFLDVLRRTHQHPLFPLYVIGVSWFIHPLSGGESALGWQRSAQLANMLAGVLLVLPLYYLGRELGGRKLAFWATLLFLCLPVTGRLLADGVSEGTYLLFCVTTLCLAVRSFRTGSRTGWLLAGIAAGLAYLTRPEAALVSAAVLLVLFFAKARGILALSWRQAGVRAAAFALAAALVVSPYWLAIGRISNKPSVGEVLEGAALEPAPPATGSALLLAARFMDGVDGKDWSGMTPLRALWEVLDESSKALLYVLWLPALAGMFAFRRELFTRPGLGLIAVVLVANLLVLWRLAMASRYVSERHTLLIALCACYLAVVFLFRLAEWLRSSPPLGKGERKMWPRTALVAGLMILVAWGTIRTLRPLHSGRKAHRQAAEWFVQNAREGDVLVDPYGFARFYAEQEPEFAKSATTIAQRRLLLIEPADRDGLREGIIADALAGTDVRDLGEPISVWPANGSPKLFMYALRN